MGAHTAMCAGKVQVLLSISLLLLLLTPATEGVELFMRLGVCASFWLTNVCGWKGVRPGVRLESRAGEPVRSPKNRSASTRTIPIGERTWTDVEPGEYSLSDYPVSKKLINLLRHGSLPRDNDAAID